jgi:hypothetical protein
MPDKKLWFVRSKYDVDVSEEDCLTVAVEESVDENREQA